MSATIVAFGHPAHPRPLTVYDWLLLTIICSPIAALYVWGVFRARRARAEIRDTLRASALEVVALKRQIFRLGPFFRTVSRGHMVYRVIVLDAAGHQRTGWARWGRTWLPEPDTLEFRWDA